MGKQQSTYSWLSIVGNAFSIVGALLTIYFALFYVPNYIRTAEKERIAVTNEDLISSIQEMVSNNQLLTPEQIRNLIHAKELKHNVVYPYSTEELLAQAQESFNATRFLSYAQRAALSARIDSVRIQIKNEPTIDEQKKEATTDWLPLVVAFLGTSVGLIGLIFSILKIKKEREVSISNEVQDKVAVIESEIKSGLEYENMISDVLLELNIPHERQSARRAVFADFVVNRKDIPVYIEAKYRLNQPIGKDTLIRLTRYILELDGPVVLVANTNPNEAAQQFISEFNSSNPSTPILFVLARNKTEMVAQFKQIFKTGG